MKHDFFRSKFAFFLMKFDFSEFLTGDFNARRISRHIFKSADAHDRSA